MAFDVNGKFRSRQKKQTQNLTKQEQTGTNQEKNKPGTKPSSQLKLTIFEKKRHKSNQTLTLNN